MKKNILAVFILVLCFANSNAQDNCRLNYRITTIPFQYLLNDYSFTFEKIVSSRRTLGLTLGYRPSTKNGGDLDFPFFGLFATYANQNFFNPLYNAITIGINSKYYFSRYTNLYIDGNIFYRFWWFDKKNCSYDNVEDEVWSGVRTERQNVYGMKLLIGNTFQIRTNIKIKPIIDLYCGVGMRYKTCKFETFNGTFEHYLFLPYVLETKSYLVPSIHLGVKMGFGWISKGR